MVSLKMILLIYHSNGFLIQVGIISLFDQRFILNNLASIADRSNVTDETYWQGSQLPEFSDVKIFIDSLLISYQRNNKTIEWNIERDVIQCTSYRIDVLFRKREKRMFMEINHLFAFLQIRDHRWLPQY